MVTGVASVTSNRHVMLCSVEYISNSCGLGSIILATNRIVETASAEYLLGQVDKYGQATNLVKMLAARGDLCAIYGHQYRGGRPGEGGGTQFADYHPGVCYRTCTICGKCQTMISEWK